MWDTCPICKREFKSDACPHSITDVLRWESEQRLRKMMREEIEKHERRNRTS